MSTVYVLELRNNKYYVGRTSNLTKRLAYHQNGNGSAWTKKHGLVKLMQSIDVDSPFYEDMIVKTMMQKHGIENVRGGSYSQIWLSREQYTTLQREINGATDKCFRCGGNHFVKDCSNENNDLGPFMKETIDIGWRIYSSGIRKTQRFINYFRDYKK